MSSDPTVGVISRKGCKGKLKKKHFSKSTPRQATSLLPGFINKGDSFLKPCVQFFAQARMTPFFLLHCPTLLSTQPRRGMGLGSGLCWDPHTCKPMQGNSGQHVLSIFAWRFSLSCTLYWCQGPDIILTLVSGEGFKETSKLRGQLPSCI